MMTKDRDINKYTKGWDFTVRWFTDGDNDGSLRNVAISSLVAVDLNSILCGLF